jgi:hypothetical protein
MGSYGVNPWIWCFEGSSGSRCGGFDPPAWRWKRAVVKGADQVPVFGDCASPCSGGKEGDLPGQFIDDPTYGTTAGNTGISNWCIFRHGCETNIVFMDWNVKKVGLKQLWKIKWHRKFDTVNSGPVDYTPYPAGWPDWMKTCRSYSGY